MAQRAWVRLGDGIKAVATSNTNAEGTHDPAASVGTIVESRCVYPTPKGPPYLVVLVELSPNAPQAAIDLLNKARIEEPPKRDA